VRKAADVLVVPGSQPIAPDHFHGALLAAVGYEPKKKPRRVIVSFARALVERAADRQLDIPAPRQCRIDGEIDIDRRNSIDALSRVSNRMLGTPSLTAKAIVIGERVQNFRCRQPEGSGSSGKLRPKSITVTTGPSSGFNTSPRPPQKCQPVRPTAAASATPPIRS